MDLLTNAYMDDWRHEIVEWGTPVEENLMRFSVCIANWLARFPRQSEMEGVFTKKLKTFGSDANYYIASEYYYY